jgi:argininosuccinate lyase
VAYCAGWDVRERPMADAVLIPYDLWVNQAHALMLYRTGIIERSVHRKIQRALTAIESDWRNGRWKLDPTLEDVHVNIERAVGERAGDKAGGWLHTARSRNDQSTTDMRLFVRDALLDFQRELIALLLELIRQARKHVGSLMPGLSHTQPAAVTTFGHVLCAHAEALLRDAEQMQATFQAVNQCPLGAAAGYGTSWPINRAAVARFLGFAGVQQNSLDCVSSRWEIEARFVADLAFAAGHLSLLAQDLIFWSMPWVGFVTFDDRYVTGSSIMPQKRNPDFAEVTRAKAAVVQGALQSLFALGKGMVSGYNRDSQWSKYLVMSAVEELGETPTIFREVIESLTVHKRHMAAATEHDFLVAVELADLIAQRARLPFRKSYEIVAGLVRECEPAGRFTAEAVERALAAHRLQGKIRRAEWQAAIKPARAVQARKSLGGSAPSAVRDNIKQLGSAAAKLRRWNARQQNAIEQARRTLRRQIQAS